LRKGQKAFKPSVSGVKAVEGRSFPEKKRGNSRGAAGASHHAWKVAHHLERGAWRKDQIGESQMETKEVRKDPALT